MKRAAPLLGLSRDHQPALCLALECRRMAGSSDHGALVALSERVVDTFARELEPHFVVEENGLLPMMREAGLHELVERTLAQHTALRAQLAKLKTPDVNDLVVFGELLAEHIRFEERELFEVAQERLKLSQLVGLG